MVFYKKKGLKLIIQPNITEIQNINLLQSILNAEKTEVKKYNFI